MGGQVQNDVHAEDLQSGRLFGSRACIQTHEVLIERKGNEDAQTQALLEPSFGMIKE